MCDWTCSWVFPLVFYLLSPPCSSCYSQDPLLSWKIGPLGFYPTSSWYHEPRWSRFRSLPSSEKIHVGFKTPSWVTPFKTSSWRWTLPCIFPFVVHVPCGSCVFDCLVDVWLDLFLSVSPCDFSPFFPVFIVFFEGTHSNRERSAYTGLAPYHIVNIPGSTMRNIYCS